MALFLSECHYKLSPRPALRLPKQLSSGIHPGHKTSRWVIPQPRWLQFPTSTPPDSEQPLSSQGFPISLGEDSEENPKRCSPVPDMPRAEENTLTHFPESQQILWVIEVEWHTQGGQRQLDRYLQGSLHTSKHLILTKIVLTCECVLHSAARKVFVGGTQVCKPQMSQGLLHYR